jgi:hypothetical protein
VNDAAAAPLERFDLRADPAEQRPLTAADAHDAELVRMMEARLIAASGDASPSAFPPPPAAITERLPALGDAPMTVSPAAKGAGDP